MPSTPLSLLSVAALIPFSLAGTSYSLVKEYAGSTFFDEWDFYGHFDNLTNGDTIFVTKDVATSSRLAYVDPSTNRAIIKVDNTSTVLFNDKRNTVRISSKDEFEVGSVWVADMYHVPFGCSVWPAFWSQAPNWPIGGEIDTFEHWNSELHNQMTLHTEPGCNQISPVQTSTVVNSTDCSHLDNSNAGCSVMDPNDSSYGAKFAAAQGGIFVTEYAESGISVWFFSRASVPKSFSSNASSFSTSDLGTPVANWPTGGCAVDTFFKSQNLIFDITLCGDAAGAPAVFAQTCPGTCYTDYVVGNGSVYNNAYFDVASVRVYSVNGTTTIARKNDASALQVSIWRVVFLLAGMSYWLSMD
ncbi:GH16 domain-containing protein [Mycena indigotica]|uniref:GH16 domain-containing protein n=1 Tax=Mycena indigotica TaxID=2126181 RepID=A0A8H6SKF1_9AGAR|nr:GH16 domain-containing protein [Mycena indigotica]KAF7299455.1 GH16 domain-containing protein [Mycena indigotica]